MFYPGKKGLPSLLMLALMAQPKLCMAVDFEKFCVEIWGFAVFPYKSGADFVSNRKRCLAPHKMQKQGPQDI